jgi:hypothetical protein
MMPTSDDQPSQPMNENTVKSEMTSPTNPHQGDFFGGNLEAWMDTTAWPDPDRFPHNYQRTSVKSQVWQDLLTSQAPLIITGYATLEMVVRLIEKYTQTAPAGATIRFLFGHEPMPPHKPLAAAQRRTLDREMVDYWLNRGISLYVSTSVLAAITALEQDTVVARLAPEHPPIHAKIYQGDQAITIGSSNFSKAGLQYQMEANVRFEQAQESSRFAEASQMAERIWAMGKPYTQELLALLEQLLRVVTWREALARACAEVLHGEWAEQYLQPHTLEESAPLWPSQAEGIAQALWIIENIGSVLVADATGSGKTRMGARLLRSTIDRLWKTGRIRRGGHVLFCPPAVQDSWQEELFACGQALHIYSHGILSNTRAGKHIQSTQALRHVQVLALDEAHGYLNRTSRTQQILTNLADHTILFTATPLNRGLDDLLAIVELLGADNFDDDIIALFDTIWKRKRGSVRLPPTDQERLRQAIQRFTMRRTKAMLNRMVEADPTAYCNRMGQPCRYPDHHPATYSCQEPEPDIQLAYAIRERAGQLRGILNLPRCFTLPPSYRSAEAPDESYLEMLLKAAPSLAVYHVMDMVRSSRAALLEHLCGTAAVQHLYGLETIPKTGTGNMMQQIQQRATQPPTNKLALALPHWLSDATAYRHACDEEYSHYEAIAQMVQRMSKAREVAKVDLLRRLLQQHPRVLAFDHHLISLSLLASYFPKEAEVQVLVASGSADHIRKQVHRLFDLGASGDSCRVLALCSDAMAEGINLQAASAVVHLDMPTVIRIAEQRVGRIDRMDSPHQRIEVYWPQDHEAFALRSDERFLARHQLVETTLGSNVPLPEAMRTEGTRRTVVTRDEVMAEARPWDGLQDAFESVRNLVSGPTALVESSLSTRMQQSQARVLSSISVVPSCPGWAFFAIGGTDRGAPRWVWLDSPESPPCTDLDVISQHLRSRLGQETTERSFDSLAASHLTSYLGQLEQTERLLLPRKKQRALNEMQLILERYRKQSQTTMDYQRFEVLTEILKLFTDTPARDMAVDWSMLAEQWLEAIRPSWDEMLSSPARRTRRPFRLRDLRGSLIHQPLTTETLEGMLQHTPSIQPVSERIVAAIIGVPIEPNAEDGSTGPEREKPSARGEPMINISGGTHE